MKTEKTDLIRQNNVYLWLTALTAFILAIPLIAMQFNTGVHWTLSDFITIAVLLLGAGFIFIQVARVAPRKYRTLIGIAFVLGVLYIWAELAVGIFTNIGS